MWHSKPTHVPIHWPGHDEGVIAAPSLPDVVKEVTVVRI